MALCRGRGRWLLSPGRRRHTPRLRCRPPSASQLQAGITRPDARLRGCRLRPDRRSGRQPSIAPMPGRVPTSSPGRRRLQHDEGCAAPIATRHRRIADRPGRPRVERGRYAEDASVGRQLLPPAFPGAGHCSVRSVPAPLAQRASAEPTARAAPARDGAATTAIELPGECVTLPHATEHGDRHPARRSRRISRAALYPHAPITPPPGWVAAPHMYSPRTGVR